MSEKKRFSKPVAFHKEKDKDILNHIKRRNFSGYVKKLILADIKGREMSKPQIEAIKEVTEAPPKEEKKVLSTSEKMAQMKKEIENKKPSNAPGPKMFN